jgi:hypothetical protein
MTPPTRQDFDRICKAFDLAQDGAKQLLTISAGIVVVTITFFNDFGSHADLAAKILMVIAWVLYLLSIIAGISVLYSLAGNLQKGRMDIYLDPTRLFSLVQLAIFMVALLLTIVAGSLAWLLA